MKASEISELNQYFKDINELQVQVANLIYPDTKDPGKFEK